MEDSESMKGRGISVGSCLIRGQESIKDGWIKTDKDNRLNLYEISSLQINSMSIEWFNLQKSV